MYQRKVYNRWSRNNLSKKRRYARDYYHTKVKLSEVHLRRAQENRNKKAEYDRARNTLLREGKLREHFCLVCGVSIKGQRRSRWCGVCSIIGKRISNRAYYFRQGWYRASRGPDWNLQKYRVLARDSYTCRCCGSVTKLCVHHIREYSGRPDDNELWNLVTLCSSCHSRGHRSKVFYWIVAEE